MILMVDMTRATCLQIQANQRNHKPVNTSYVNTKFSQQHSKNF